MFKFLLGLIVGANVSLFLYACILMGKMEDKINENGESNERRKSN